MITRPFVRLALAALATTMAVTPAAAQFGTYSWQMQPYCNRVTLTLAPAPGGAAVSGFDDLCGAPDRASAVGMASLNAGGNVTLGFSIVTTPNARPVHVVAVVNLANGSGTWTPASTTCAGWRTPSWVPSTMRLPGYLGRPRPDRCL